MLTPAIGITADPAGFLELNMADLRGTKLQTKLYQRHKREEIFHLEVALSWLNRPRNWPKVVASNHRERAKQLLVWNLAVRR